MCTVSVIPLCRQVGYRLVTNRDELRTRPIALPPRTHEPAPGLHAIWPIDPGVEPEQRGGVARGGTWVAANHLGVTLCTMNINPDPRPAPPPAHVRRSRGMLIPELIDSRTAMGAIERLADIDIERFQPFRLIAVDRRSVIDAVWDHAGLRTNRRAMAPVCFATSGIGDHRVVARLSLFDWWFAQGRGTEVNEQRQDGFHLHRWPERGEVSVNMSRAEARTVSITAVRVAMGTPVRMTYRDHAGATSEHGLPVATESLQHAGV